MENLERTYCVNNIIKNLCNIDESSLKELASSLTNYNYIEENNYA